MKGMNSEQMNGPAGMHLATLSERHIGLLESRRDAKEAVTRRLFQPS
jgi:hypothetical protein